MYCSRDLNAIADALAKKTEALDGINNVTHFLPIPPSFCMVDYHADCIANLDMTLSNSTSDVIV